MPNLTGYYVLTSPVTGKTTLKYNTLQEWNQDMSEIYILSTVFICLYLILGVSGNSLVVIIYKIKMNISKKDDRYFIPALAIVDLFGSAFASTFSLIQNVLPVMFPGSFSCQILNYGTSTFIIASLFILLIISVQRFQKICRPFGFQMSLSFKRFASILTFILANVLSIPFVYLYKNIEITSESYNGTGNTMWFNSRY